MSETLKKSNEWVFSWNRFGWFAGLLGGNAALLIGGIQFFPHSALVGLTWLLAYLIVAIATLFLWHLRSSISAYRGVQWSLGISGLCWLLSFAMAIFYRPDLIPVVSSPPSTTFQRWLMKTIVDLPALALLPLLIFPAIMVWLHLLNRRRADHKQS